MNLTIMFREALHGDIMKNKKVIFLTIIIVTVALIGVLSMSRVFETMWQNTGTSENNLDVDESNLQQQTAFNYPYIIDNGQTVDWDNQYITTPPEDVITWQQAANIAGETIKDIFGITNHQKSTAKMCYYDRPNTENERFSGETYYYYSEWDKDINGVIQNINVWAYIDAHTGEVLLLNNVNETAKTERANVEWQAPTDNIKKKLLKDTNDILAYFGKNEVVRFKIYNMGISTELYSSNPIKTYMIMAYLSDEQLVQLYFDMDPSTDNILLSYNNHSWMNHITSVDVTDWEYASDFL